MSASLGHTPEAPPPTGTPVDRSTDTSPGQKYAFCYLCTVPPELLRDRLLSVTDHKKVPQIDLVGIVLWCLLQGV